VGANWKSIPKEIMFTLFRKVAVIVLASLILTSVGQNLQQRAWLKIVIGLFAEAFTLVNIKGNHLNLEDRFVLWFVALPLVYAATGIMELLTGKPFARQIDEWNGLAPERRSQITVVIMAVAFALIAIAGTAYIRLCFGR
jgi:hypothetical protein